jgi:hypothetical protein
MADDEETPLRLGGMALTNGLFVHGPTHWAAAVRDPDGLIQVADGRKAGGGAGAALTRVPLARGIVRMAEMLALLPQVRRALPAARLPFENPTLAVSAAVGAAAARGVRASRLNPVATEAVVAAVSMAPALLTLRSPSLTRYHGAEHKAIGAYESGGTPEDEPKEHARCGSHLVGPLLGTSPERRARSREPRLAGHGRRDLRLDGPQRHAPRVARVARAGLRPPASAGHARARAGGARGGPGGPRPPAGAGGPSRRLTEGVRGL